MTLWRPTGQAELDLVAASGWRAWPPRLPGQPILDPVLNRWYATKITREWNIAHEGVGYVTRFDVRRRYLGRYTVQQAGGRDVLEDWIPAEDLAEFNANIIGADQGGSPLPRPRQRPGSHPGSPCPRPVPARSVARLPDGLVLVLRRLAA